MSSNVIHVETTPRRDPDSTDDDDNHSQTQHHDQSILERFWITLDKQSYSPGQKVTGVVSLVVATDEDNGDVTGRIRSGRFAAAAKRRVYLRVKALWLDFNVQCDMVFPAVLHRRRLSSLTSHSVSWE